MKPPRSINIVGHDYTIEVLKAGLPMGEADGLEKERLGHFDGLSCALEVRVAAPSQMRETTLHEILHAIQLHANFPALNEKIIGTLAPALLDTLRRNPRLAAYLLDRERRSVPHAGRHKPARDRVSPSDDPDRGVSAMPALSGGEEAP